MDSKVNILSSEKGKDTSELAVVILNYKTWKDTLKEIETVHDVAGICYKDIIVIDNCSPNESAKKLKEASEGKFIFIALEENGGYAKGNNVGLRYAFEKGYPYVWILNNDIIIEDRDIVFKLLNVIKKNNLIAVVNPDIYARDGHLFNRDAIRPNFFDLTIGMFLYVQKGRILESRGDYGYIYRPQGCCMILDVKKAITVGLLDERTFLYSEEIIFAERLLRKGYRCACCTSTKVIHNHSKTVRSSFQKKELRKIQKDSYEYYLKQYRGYGQIKARIGVLFYDIKLRLIETMYFRKRNKIRTL